MKKKLTAVLTAWVLFLLVHAVASANDSVAANALSWSSCRIHAASGTTQSKGSGCYLGNQWVLTAAHVTDEDQDGRVLITTRAVESIEGTVIARDKISDMSLVRLDRPPRQLQPIQIAPSDPLRGDTVYQAGFGSDGKFRIVRGNVAMPQAGPDQRYSHVWFCQTGSARSGDSGGPVCNASGQLIGPLWGSDARITTSSRTSTTRGFITQCSHRIATPLRDGLRMLVGARPVNAYAGRQSSDFL